MPGVYWVETQDDTFIANHKETLLACLQSLLNRDHPDAAAQWINGFDSARTDGGGEITTYDSGSFVGEPGITSIWLGSVGVLFSSRSNACPC